MMEQAESRYVVTPGVGSVFFSPEQLSHIAAVAGPGGRIELNAFMQLIVHTFALEIEPQQATLRAAGLGVYPAGPVVKNIQTCTFCMGERTDGLPDARRLDDLVAGSRVPFPVRIGFSGCSSNCGEALTRDIGVVRMAGGQYDIFIGGRPGSLTPRIAEQVAAGVAAADLPAVVAALLETYRQMARGKERLWKNVARVGTDPYRQAAGQTRT